MFTLNSLKGIEDLCIWKHAQLQNRIQIWECPDSLIFPTFDACPRLAVSLPGLAPEISIAAVIAGPNGSGNRS
jgi:hypothetical protein